MKTKIDFYIEDYDSPLGKLLLAAEEEGLTGLWFYDQRFFASGLGDALENEYKSHPLNDLESDSDKIPETIQHIFSDTRRWLDTYFAGEMDQQSDQQRPKLSLRGTEFQKLVWQELLHIPYGSTTTYGEIAKTVADKMGKKAMSAQAVGSAVGHNKIGIIMPCHRVIGKDGTLTGYAGGLDRKAWLLEMESRATKGNKYELPKVVSKLPY